MPRCSASFTRSLHEPLDIRCGCLPGRGKHWDHAPLRSMPPCSDAGTSDPRADQRHGSSTTNACQSALEVGSPALVVQVGGLRSDGLPHRRDIFGSLMPRFVSLCSAADPGRTIGRAGAPCTRLRHHPDRNANPYRSTKEELAGSRGKHGLGVSPTCAGRCPAPRRRPHRRRWRWWKAGRGRATSASN